MFIGMVFCEKSSGSRINGEGASLCQEDDHWLYVTFQQRTCPVNSMTPLASANIGDNADQ